MPYEVVDVSSLQEKFFRPYIHIGRQHYNELESPGLRKYLLLTIKTARWTSVMNVISIANSTTISIVSHDRLTRYTYL